MQRYILEINNNNNTFSVDKCNLYALIAKSRVVSPLYRNFLLVSKKIQEKQILIFNYSDNLFKCEITDEQLKLFDLEPHKTYRLIKVKQTDNSELYAIEEEHGSFIMCSNPRMYVKIKLND